MNGYAEVAYGTQNFKKCSHPGVEGGSTPPHFENKNVFFDSKP